MQTLEQTVDGCLKTIGTSCPHLMAALSHSPEAVLGEIQVIESAGRAFDEAYLGLPAKSEAAAQMMTCIATLRGLIGRYGLRDADELAAFREDVLAIQSSACQLRDALMNHRPLKTYVFYCSNRLDADQIAAGCRELAGDAIKTVSLPCSGKVDIPYLLKAFETGADGVLLLTCKKNECRHIEGNLRAHKRAEAVESLLAEIGLGAGRMAVIEGEAPESGQVLNEIKRFNDRLKTLPQPSAGGGAAN